MKRFFRRLTWKQIFSIGLVFAVTGCATSGISGTTKLKSNYDSQVMADGTDHTVVNVEASGKAADVLKAVTTASLYSKDSEGNERNMNFGAAQDNDATKRGDIIKDINELWAAQTAGFMAMLQQFASIAGPLVGKNIEVDAQTEALRIQSRADRDKLIKEIADSVIKQLPKPPAVTPAPAPQPAPVVTPTPEPTPGPVEDAQPRLPVLVTPEP